MNSLGITPLEDGVCYICQEAPATNEFRIADRGYGSMFDGQNLRLWCCKQCVSRKLQEWFADVPRHSEYGESYKHERELFAFLDALPVNSQEKIFNGADGFTIDAQDWIDLHLGELSAKKKKQYGFDDELFDREYEV